MAGDDLLARHLVGGSRQRDAWHVGKAFGEDGQPDIFRAEIVPPLRYAMRLVDREQRDIGLAEQTTPTILMLEIDGKIRHLP